MRIRQLPPELRHFKNNPCETDAKNGRAEHAHGGWGDAPPPQLSGFGISASPVQGTGEAVVETAMAVPCIGKPTTKDNTSKAAQIR